MIFSSYISLEEPYFPFMTNEYCNGVFSIYDEGFSYKLQICSWESSTTNNLTANKKKKIRESFGVVEVIHDDDTMTMIERKLFCILIIGIQTSQRNCGISQKYGDFRNLSGNLTIFMRISPEIRPFQNSRNSQYSLRIPRKFVLVWEVPNWKNLIIIMNRT